jgi:hypothetical protein
MIITKIKHAPGQSIFTLPMHLRALQGRQAPIFISSLTSVSGRDVGETLRVNTPKGNLRLDTVLDCDIST